MKEWPWLRSLSIVAFHFLFVGPGFIERGMARGKFMPAHWCVYIHANSYICS